MLQASTQGVPSHAETRMKQRSRVQKEQVPQGNEHTAHKSAVQNNFESAPQTIRARSSGAWLCKQLAMQVDISLV